MHKTLMTLSLSSMLLAATVMAQGKNPGEESIVAIATGPDYGPVFTTLVDLVGKAGLDQTLTVDGQFTVFAPINDAFLPFGADGDEVEASLEALCETEDATAAITNILLHHVRDGRRNSNSLLGRSGPKPVEMLNGYIWISAEGVITDGAGNNSAEIQIEDELFDLSASNGVIHVIDKVLLPDNVCQGTVTDPS